MQYDPLKELVITEGNLDRPCHEKGAWFRTNGPECLPRGWVWNEEDKVALWQPVRLLGLDIDEVMTNRATNSFNEETPTICPEKVRAISELCLRFDLKLFLCSTWANHAGDRPTQTIKLLEAMGFPARCVYLNAHLYDNLHSFRGLNVHNLLSMPECNDVVDMVIVDDSCDYLPYQMRYLVHVSAIDGFTTTDFCKIETYFGEGKQNLNGQPNAEMGIRKSGYARHYFVKHLPEYTAQLSLNRGENFVYDDTVFCALMPIEKETPLVLTGPNKNIRVVDSQELAVLIYRNFLGRKEIEFNKIRPIILPGLE